MTMFLLTVAGVLSILAMIRSVMLVEHSFTKAVCLGVFGFISFIITIILTNGVAP